MRQLFRIFFGGNDWDYRWGLAGLGIKILLIAICVGIIVAIILVAERNKKKIREEAEYDIVVRKINKKVIALCIAVPVVMIAVMIGGVFALSAKYDFFYEMTGSPGIYVERQESVEDHKWEVKCTALTSGSLKKVINGQKNRLETLVVNNGTIDGDLKLVLEQDGETEEFEINTTGETEINLKNFKADTIRLAMEHSKADDVAFTVEWK